MLALSFTSWSAALAGQQLRHETRASSLVCWAYLPGMMGSHVVETLSQLGHQGHSGAISL